MSNKQSIGEEIAAILRSIGQEVDVIEISGEEMVEGLLATIMMLKENPELLKNVPSEGGQILEGVAKAMCARKIKQKLREEEAKAEAEEALKKASSNP